MRRTRYNTPKDHVPKVIQGGKEFIASNNDFTTSNAIVYKEGPQPKICGLVIGKEMLEISYSDGSTRNYKHA